MPSKQNIISTTISQHNNIATWVARPPNTMPWNINYTTWQSGWMGGWAWRNVFRGDPGRLVGLWVSSLAPRVLIAPSSAPLGIGSSRSPTTTSTPLARSYERGDSSGVCYLSIRPSLATERREIIDHQRGDCVALLDGGARVSSRPEPLQRSSFIRVCTKDDSQTLGASLSAGIRRMALRISPSLSAIDTRYIYRTMACDGALEASAHAAQSYD